MTRTDAVTPTLTVSLPSFGPAPAGGWASLLDLARTLGLEVVAEGIEREGQFEQLRGSCDLGQGYLFARPLRTIEADALVAGATRLGGAAVVGHVGA